MVLHLNKHKILEIIKQRFIGEEEIIKENFDYNFIEINEDVKSFDKSQILQKDCDIEEKNKFTKTNVSNYVEFDDEVLSIPVNLSDK